MRSQLDCQDDRLPGSGVFDIKTRACLPIRHDRANYLVSNTLLFEVVKADEKENNQYSILKDKGARLSFEKEYYDIVRAGMLKWSYVLLYGFTRIKADEQYASEDRWNGRNFRCVS